MIRVPENFSGGRRDVAANVGMIFQKSFQINKKIIIIEEKMLGFVSFVVIGKRNYCFSMVGKRRVVI
jgi:hypothetical protein